VTTKAFDAVEAARSAKPTEGTTIIVLCNGALAVRDALKEAGLTSIFLALTTHGAYRETTNADDKFHRHVVHAGYGETVLENCESTAAVWNQAGLNCRSSADIEEMLWFKLAANCVVNPLTAVYGCTNGALRDVVHDFDTHYCPSVLNEVASVYVATMKSEEDAVQETTATNLVSKLKSYVDTVIRDTAQNKSSMWQDILKARQENRPAKTEIDYLNGYIVRAGAQRGIPCPVNQELWDRVLGLSGD
jgi:2-dehydropantoate 2-reductase